MIKGKETKLLTLLLLSGVTTLKYLIVLLKNIWRLCKERFGHDELREMYYWHALPDDWQNMEYDEFLDS